MGQGPGLPDYVQGETGGVATVTLQTTNLPSHTHGIAATAALPAHGGAGSSDNPVTNVPSGSTSAENYAPASPANASLGGGSANLTAQPIGTGQPFGKMPPYLAINLCIAIQGIFPSRS
jgi:microcystin-dependent protein